MNKNLFKNFDADLWFKNEYKEPAWYSETISDEDAEKELLIKKELGKMSDEEMSKYGQWMVGIWICSKCNYEIFPRQLAIKKEQLPFMCTKCNVKLYYDEQA